MTRERPEVSIEHDWSLFSAEHCVFPLIIPGPMSLFLLI
jgi:hypothetical protein